MDLYLIIKQIYPSSSLQTKKPPSGYEPDLNIKK